MMDRRRKKRPIKSVGDEIDRCLLFNREAASSESFHRRRVAPDGEMGGVTSKHNTEEGKEVRFHRSSQTLCSENLRTCRITNKRQTSLA